jgi:NitT/TauT family transport system permease protein
LLLHTLQTLYSTLIGFVLGISIGVVLGTIVDTSKTDHAVACPLLIGFSSIPKVAVLLIFVLWFGSDTTPAILMAVVKCVFQIVISIATI